MKHMFPSSALRLAAAACGLAGLFLASCNSTSFAPSKTQDAFAARYGTLEPVESKTGRVVLADPDANIRHYSKVHVRPVQFKADTSKLKSKMTPEEKAMLTEYVEDALRRSLGEDYAITSRPGAGTLQARVAVTEASSSMPLLDAFTSAWPSAYAISAAKKVATGTHSFVGKACLEVEVRNSRNQKLLAAQITRAGTKDWKGKFDRWQDFKAAADYVADDVATRLGEIRNGTMSAN